MSNRLINAPAVPQLASMYLPADPGVSQPCHAGMVSGGYADTVHTLFQQLAQALTVLSSASELVMNGKAEALPSQVLRVWLQPNARQAERAIHALRALRLTTAPALTELSQCMTVLVLAADMLAQGQLSGGDALTFYSLLRRNAAGATKSLHELRAQLDPAAR